MRAWPVVLVIMLAQLVLAQPIMLVASSGETLTGAVVEVEKLDGERQVFTVGPEGVIVVREVPLGILRVRVISWKGVPIDYRCLVTPLNTTIRVPAIHRFTVNVVGARRQGLADATVRILHEGREIERGVTDASGTYKTLLPAASYTVVAEYGGRAGEQRVEVVGPTEVTLQLDIFGEIGGLPISTGEFMLMIALLALIPLVLFVIAYEYAQWRRKRVLRVVAPAVEKGG
ncbi:MAG: carboxypeptidase-like regulatory domain-containing protein [Thermofilaceae archaeon]